MQDLDAEQKRTFKVDKRRRANPESPGARLIKKRQLLEHVDRATCAKRQFQQRHALCRQWAMGEFGDRHPGATCQSGGVWFRQVRPLIARQLPALFGSQVHHLI